MRHAAEGEPNTYRFFSVRADIGSPQFRPEDEDIMAIDVPENVRHELQTSERLVWLGQPNARRYAWQKGFYWFLIGVIWSVFAGFAEYKALTASAAASEQHSMAGLLIAFGLVMLVRPFQLYYAALRTTYVVTDRRLVIFSGVIEAKVESYQPPFDIIQRENPDGSGSISFSRDEQDHVGLQSFKRDIELAAIPDVQQVQRYVMGIESEPA